jgi:hypothetical protein
MDAESLSPAEPRPAAEAAGRRLASQLLRRAAAASSREGSVAFIGAACAVLSEAVPPSARAAVLPELLRSVVPVLTNLRQSPGGAGRIQRAAPAVTSRAQILATQLLHREPSDPADTGRRFARALRGVTKSDRGQAEGRVLSDSERRGASGPNDGNPAAGAQPQP